jgi:taurine dioxygenase
MPPAESDELLNAVFDHAEKPEFVYRHVRRIGDLIVWDNRCSMHARTDFPSDQRRLLLRTKVKGTVRPYRGTVRATVARRKHVSSGL